MHQKQICLQNREEPVSLILLPVRIPGAHKLQCLPIIPYVFKPSGHQHPGRAKPSATHQGSERTTSQQSANAATCSARAAASRL